ncbi:MAG: MFS transporter [Gammaproteobacteria bacterium]|nr:MFS transporter [Gammaproteobacteria bacterium]
MTTAASPPSSRYRAWVMFMLVLVYTFNFIDRQIVSILAPAIKTDLGLSDTELGLMGGIAFALFYTGLGIPVAMLADRRSRTWIMTIALALWSAMTALCGLASNFWQLFLARLGVGVGEAGGVAPAYSLIADYFEPRQRARALSVYAFGIPIGSALGILLGGFIATHIDWRYAFFVVGIAGVLLAPVFKLTVREPQRGQYDSVTDNPTASFGEVLSVLMRRRSFWFLSVGAATASIVGYGVFFWLPSFLIRSYDLTVFEASLYVGGIFLIGGVAGMWLGGWSADFFGARNRRAYATVPAVAFLLITPFYFLALTASSLPIVVVALLIPMALGLAWLGPVTSAIQHIVRPHMRATASAVFLFINNLIGLGLGTLVIGAVSDALTARFGDEALRYAILGTCSLYVLAATLFFLGRRHLEHDWQHARAN